jgi:hypothetical protein
LRFRRTCRRWRICGRMVRQLWWTMFES